MIEMLVVIAIIGIITIVVITSQGSFNKSIILSNAAYDLALALRSAESYGLGSRVLTPEGTHTGYGLEFTVGQTFTLFADPYPAQPTSSLGCHPAPPAGDNAPDAKWGDCIYDSAQDQKVTTYTLHRGITVSDVCAYSTSGSFCAGASAPNHLDRLDIVFVRPNPTPFLSKDGAYDSGSPITSACITLTSPQGGVKYVAVSAAGQIDANAAPCL